MIRATQRITVFRSRKLQSIVTLIFVLLILPVSAGSNIPPLPDLNVIRGRTGAGHPYLNGGITLAEQRVMERAAKPYNLKLMFASKVGTLISPSFVMIGTNNSRHIEKIRLRAPWFYIQLPAGGYTILARFKRQVVMVTDVYISEGRRRTYLLRGE